MVETSSGHLEASLTAQEQGAADHEAEQVLQLDIDCENEGLAQQVEHQETKLDNLLDQEATMWKEKSGNKWYKHGDRCTSFFFHYGQNQKKQSFDKRIAR
ncbi:hypothetical protein IFM89_007502 [Coptis chinensis]|uniref:Uncharacterized protein n=1 Tax=Coptis chinensis TaxID=261450 RepID=A0A835LLS8_9MAGN|nr:hypothetical protein IFM89_007502 [Coptis chinensis]